MSSYKYFINLLKRKKINVKKNLQWVSFASRVKPKVAIDEVDLPSGPDYSILNTWAAHPELNDKSGFVPNGIDPDIPKDGHESDVFFIHPTTYFGTQTWNAPLNHKGANEAVDELIMPGQASVFNSSCKIYAPRYRQATFYSFLKGDPSGRKALELAYDDVASSFEYYLTHWNKGRPFIIASHSQGTLHATRLLEEKIDKTNLREKMIAAYVIGFQIPEEKFTNRHFKNLKVSESSVDVNCIIAWDTYSENGGPSKRFDKAEHYYHNSASRWIPRAHKKPISTNPLSWKRTHDKVEKEANTGAVHVQLANAHKIDWAKWGGETPIGLKTTGLSSPYKNEVSAMIKDDGFLYVSWPRTKAFTRMVMPGGNFHNYDYALFYMNIRQNVKDRVEAFLNS